MAKKRIRRLRDNLAALAVLKQYVAEQERKIIALMRDQAPVGTLAEEPCPDLSDPNAQVDVYLCQLGVRVLYDLGFFATCQDYIDSHNACSSSS